MLVFGGLNVTKDGVTQDEVKSQPIRQIVASIVTLYDYSLTCLVVNEMGHSLFV